MKHEIFPTSVWHIKGTPQELVDELYNAAYRCKENFTSINKSNEGGYQSPLFSWKEFHPNVAHYIEDILKRENLSDNKITEWWFNINSKGAWNTPHTHPGFKYALVLYLTDSYDSPISFINPFSYRNGQGYQSLNTKKGDIVIFPSDMIHMVFPNKSKYDRISLSMNII